MIPENAKKHPWGNYLDARMKAMAWMIKEFGYSDAQLAGQFTMSETQVYLIRSNKLNKEYFEDKNG